MDLEIPSENIPICDIELGEFQYVKKETQRKSKTT